MIVLVSIDGMRPDALTPEVAPNLNRMMQNGCSSLTAQTVMPSVTLPCHTSMFRGVPTERHGITTNTFHPLARPVPSIFDMAHQAGKKTGFFFNWPELRDLCEPSSVDISIMIADNHRPEGDDLIVDEFLRFPDLDLAFVYLGWLDECGHDYQWMGSEYMEALHNADACVARMQAARPEATFLVLADHGGHDRHHGSEMPEDMTIPWILCGPQVTRRGAIEESVRIFDAAPTLAKLLEIAPSPIWEGQVIHFQ